MVTVSSGYTNYQELLLDLDILGAILSAKQPTREELYRLALEEFESLYPVVTVEDKRYELSDTVSRSYHVDYISNIELLNNENLILKDKPDDAESPSSILSEIDISAVSLPDDLLVTIRGSEMLTATKRSKLIDAYLDMNFNIDDFRGSVEEVESVYNTVDIDSNSIPDEVKVDSYDEVETPDISEPESDVDDDVYYGYGGEEGEVDFDTYDESLYSSYTDNDYEGDTDEDDYNPYSSYTDNDDEGDEYDNPYAEEEYSEDGVDSTYDNLSSSDEDVSGYLSQVFENTDNVQHPHETGTKITQIDEDFVDSVFDEPEVVIKPTVSPTTPVKVPKTGIKPAEKPVEKEEKPIPKDIREFLRLYPHSDISVVLQHFSRNEVKKALLSGKIIRKGSKLHI